VKIIVVGAGAAGLMAAVFAARAGQEVLLLESTAEGGKKILISGGGRCNVLPSQPAPERFVTDSAPHLMRGLLRSWPLEQQREFFERDLDLPLALEPETGKLFPVSNRARDVRDGLLEFARKLGVAAQFNTSLRALEPGDGTWSVHTNRGVVQAARVVIATGGLSVPATGSDGVGLRLVETLGHRINRTYPALTPLVSAPPAHADLSGISVSVRLRGRTVPADKKVVETSGGFVFTHRGYSGPAVLDISHVATRNPAAVIRVQWTSLAASEWERLLAGRGALASSVVASRLPQRLASRLLQESDIPADRRASELRRHERIALIDALTSYRLPWTGDEGFRKAEVTGGGVALEELDSRTLESRRHPGLFLCGEILDAFGPIGGHNFAWAWSTGRLAGTAAGR
jgi:predicted Rossmann fold flavoprotein